ncbi:somatostatin receptor type 2-like [Mercenaria mercenaria]|uniref:somatostatin receptor type 2-like n=1 Tax=Mercenaria mercenaria TaxID=6596 RepID=UPI001E1DBEEF|nr:somatostatin receptor type 2-like [Mercenaria mercenaria]
MESLTEENVTNINVTLYDNNQTWSFFPPPPPAPPKDVLLNFKKYAYIITCVIGIIGNIIIFFVFTRTKLKKPSTARYLAAAAVADSGFLLVVMCVNLEEFYKIRVHSVIGPCQLITFGDHAFSFLCRWYLTAVIIEKYIGVMWPRKKTKMCTVFRAKCVIISLAIISIVSYLYMTWFVGVYGDPPVCRLFYSNKQVLESWKILTKMDSIVNFVVPYLTIFLLTCLIAYRSWEYHRRSMTASERFLRRRRVTTPEDKEFKTTPLLILLAMSTLILSIPNSAMRILAFSDDFRPTESTMMMMHLFHYFVVLNSAIKICIYLIASNAFARQLGRSFCMLKSVLKKSDDSELQTRHITEKMDGVAIEGKV